MKTNTVKASFLSACALFLEAHGAPFVNSTHTHHANNNSPTKPTMDAFLSTATIMHPTGSAAFHGSSATPHPTHPVASSVGRRGVVTPKPVVVPGNTTTTTKSNNTFLTLKDYGYEINPVTFIGPAFVDGPNVTLKGTVEEIYSKLLEYNPRYLEESREIEKRCGHLIPEDPKTPAYDDVRCNSKSYSNAHKDKIEKGIEYMDSLKGLFNVGPGPKNCSMISCSKNSGIYLCNDSPGHYVDTWLYASNYVKYMTKWCPFAKGKDFNAQMFNTGGDFNVLAAWGDCK